MPKLKHIHLMKSLDENLWHDLTSFEKMSSVKDKQKRNNWRTRRNRCRIAKRRFQEYNLGTHGR